MILAVRPKYLVVGLELEMQAEKLLAAANADDVNPFAGKLPMVAEPRITSDSWRSGPSVVAAICEFVRGAGRSDPAPGT